MASDPLALTSTESTEKLPRQRRRAPRRGGRRAQLTVPDDMWDQVAGIARAAGTTPNDVLVHLVAERLEDRGRSLALRRRADERWRAFAETNATAQTPADPLSEEELIGLSGAFRADVEG
jgi:hypothetical protein